MNLDQNLLILPSYCSVNPYLLFFWCCSFFISECVQYYFILIVRQQIIIHILLIVTIDIDLSKMNCEDPHHIHTHTHTYIIYIYWLGLDLSTRRTAINDDDSVNRYITKSVTTMVMSKMMVASWYFNIICLYVLILNKSDRLHLK